MVGINCPGINVIQGALVVGETNNFGNPRADYEEGRSRFIPYPCCLSMGIFGIQSYDAGGSVIWNDITFYNFNNYQFTKTNNTIPTGAITAIDGPNVLTPSNKFFNMKFNNVDNPVYYQQSIFLADQNALKVQFLSFFLLVNLLIVANILLPKKGHRVGGFGRINHWHLWLGDRRSRRAFATAWLR